MIGDACARENVMLTTDYPIRRRHIDCVTQIPSHCLNLSLLAAIENASKSPITIPIRISIDGECYKGIITGAPILIPNPL